jgi:hypothetical protein
MNLMDLITMVMLILWLFLATILHVLIRGGKLKSETWPRVFAVGTGVFMFVGLMITSILLRPMSEIVDHTVTNFFLSFAFSIVVYFGSRTLASRHQDKN